MKTKLFKQELKRLSSHELHIKLEQMRQDLFKLRFDVGSHVKDYSQFGKLRRDIARIATVLRLSQ